MYSDFIQLTKLKLLPPPLRKKEQLTNTIVLNTEALTKIVKDHKTNLSRGPAKITRI